MRLPDFVVIGAAKAGTTSLYALLDRHPDIFMPEIKEPEFFARDDLYAQGVAQYAKAYAQAHPEQLVGEASTMYTLSPLFPDTAARLAEHIPQARLIYVMREPVARAYSFYVQIIKNYQNITGDASVHRSFEEFVDAELRATASPREKVFSPVNAHLPDTPELCVAGSDYLHQIKTYLAHFPREQMLFLKFEDFVADRPAALRKITDFLGLEPLDGAVFDEASVTRNIAEDHFRVWGERVAVDKVRARSGGLWALRGLLPKRLRRLLRDKLLRAAPQDRAHIPPSMQPDTRAKLAARFGAQRAELSELTGLDLEDWVR